MPTNIPKHRFKYTNLTKDQIAQRLKATDPGPKSVSELSDVLSGKTLRIVTDKGLRLNYTFKGKNQLTVSENGGSAIQAGYGALTIKQGVLFSHMVPGTQKGYNVYVDLETDLVTVFEVWFSSGMSIGRDQIVEDREVQREFYFGYVETSGKKPPETRHHLTNRIEGKGVYWKQDTGVETLELYASVISVNFVEMTRQMDYLSFCFPSDYVMLSPTLFLHSRSESEFSGVYTMYVMDMFTPVTQAGVHLGFNEKDELEYYMFRGTGEIVGQLAALEPFSEHGRNGMIAEAAAKTPPKDQAAKPAAEPVKGQRTVYRPVRSFAHMTDEQMHEAALKSTSAFGGAAGIDAPQMMASNALPFTDKLVGKEFTVRSDRDGPVLHYRVKEKYRLSYRLDGESQWRETDYRCYEGDDNLFFFSHILLDTKPRASVQIVMDFTNGLSTCIHSQMGTPYYGNETTYYAHFGVVEMAGINPPMYIRHEYTYDLVGAGISWSYSDSMTSMHLFASPHSMSWTIFTDNQTRGMQWSSPCIMIKLRPMIYLFCQNEEACNGAEMCELFNLKLMRGSGFGYSGSARGVNLGLVGALGRYIGKYDIEKFFGPKAR